MKISSEQWKEWLGQLEVLKTYYARLSERERYIVLGVGAAVILFIMISIYGFFAASASRMGKTIEKSKEHLKELSELKTSYIDAERQIRRLEQTIRRTNPNFRLPTELEKIALKHGVSIDSLKDRAGPPNDLYQETQVLVSVRQVTLLTLINFLFEIENSRQLLRITSLQVKPGFQEPTKLNVNFIVSTFQPVR